MKSLKSSWKKLGVFLTPIVSVLALVQFIFDPIGWMSSSEQSSTSVKEVAGTGNTVVIGDNATVDQRTVNNFAAEETLKRNYYSKGYVEVFSVDLPYPTGYNRVKVGGSMLSVLDIYPEADSSGSSQVISLRAKSEIIDTVYYINSSKRIKASPNITAIGFRIRDSFQRDFRAEIVEKLSEFESERNAENGVIKWISVNGVNVSLEENGAMLLTEAR